MIQPAARARVRSATEHDIRRTARQLLVDHGPEAVTLRAIARELGITAPALYRYYASREDLIEHLRLEVCDDLAAELATEGVGLPDDGALQFFAICRGFRRWALEHPSEFTLVFASPAGAGVNSALRRIDEPFGRVFLSAGARVLTMFDVVAPPAEVVPESLRSDLEAFQADLLAVLTESGQWFPVEKLDLGVTFLMIQLWARIYGHVTLEVFGNYPVLASDPDALFDSTLAAMARELGLV